MFYTRCYVALIIMKLVQKMYGDGFSKYYLYKKYFGIWIKIYSSFNREECIKQSNILKRKVILTGVEFL